MKQDLPCHFKAIMHIISLVEPAMSAQQKPTNLTINADLLRESKAVDTNLSQAFEAHLAVMVKTKKQEKWLAENREAIDAYNRFVDENGVFSDGWRSF